MPSSFYADFAQPAMLALARAGNRGCLVDTALREKLALEADAEVERLRAETQQRSGHADFNADSPKQCAELLYRELQLPEQRKRPVGGHGLGAVTTDEEAVKKLRRLFPQHDALLTSIIDYRGATNEAARLRAPLEVRDGQSYFVTSYNATGTVTGRISSSATILGLGGNLQNQTRGRSRRMFVARPGMLFVKADGSQAEARVVAACCRDTALLRRFEDPSFDVHVENAVLCYGGTPEEIRAEDAERAAGRLRDSRRRKTKGVTHGANYRGGPNVAVKQADIPYAEAKVAIAKYRASKPLLLRWWDEVEALVRTQRSIRTCWGRLRIFLGRVDDATLREATAQEPQSTVGDLINHAFFRLDERLAPLGAWPLLQAHDEIVCEAVRGTEAQVAAILAEELEQELCIHGCRLRIPAEVGIGPNWYDLEEWKR